MQGINSTPQDVQAIQLFLIYLQRAYGLSDAATYHIGEHMAQRFSAVNNFARKSVRSVTLPRGSIRTRSA